CPALNDSLMNSELSPSTTMSPGVMVNMILVLDQPKWTATKPWLSSVCVSKIQTETLDEPNANAKSSKALSMKERPQQASLKSIPSSMSSVITWAATWSFQTLKHFSQTIAEHARKQSITNSKVKDKK